MEKKVQELADHIKALSTAEREALANLGVIIKLDSDPHCPQGQIWNGTKCVPDVGP
jgi:hypothetical protein